MVRCKISVMYRDWCSHESHNRWPTTAPADDGVVMDIT